MATDETIHAVRVRDPQGGSRMSSGDCRRSIGIDRRGLFKLLASGGVVASSAAAAALTSCAAEVADNETSLSLDELPLGQRVRVMLQDLPVEVIRTDDGVTARSLWCTHMGCEVRWSEEQQQYLCPCHEGVYNARGFPIEGPPPRPLATVPIRVEEDRVVIVGPEQDS